MSTIEESLFKKTIKDGSPLKCPICLGILEKPSRLPCGHVFCKVCLRGVNNCPLDRESFANNNVVPDRYLER